ncbi:MAG: putative zinc-binding metallopeptidase [Pseudomonadota bacterium]
MRRFTCRCGQALFFDNHRCERCGRQLGFEPGRLELLAEPEPGDGLPFCRNRDSAIRCNWLADGPDPACLSCRSSKVIPSLSKPQNRERWRKLEVAKRRLVYDLLRLGLPVDPTRLRFMFKEDRRTNPNVHEEHVSIGHARGVITINAAEADEVYREQMRQQMFEPYRTLLGHFRHESGHYYFDVIVDDETRRDAARRVFGEQTGYDEALARYYRDGPAPDWPARYISSYASAHPAEDWAETWAHYLHIRAALETASANGLLRPDLRQGGWCDGFAELAVGLNELMRSLGLPDAYPFILNAAVAEKLDFIHEAVQAYVSRPDAHAPAAV